MLGGNVGWGYYNVCIEWVKKITLKKWYIILVKNSIHLFYITKYTSS